MQSNNYNLFKYGQVATSVDRKKYSTSSLHVPEINPNKHKNVSSLTRIGIT